MHDPSAPGPRRTGKDIYICAFPCFWQARLAVVLLTCIMDAHTPV